MFELLILRKNHLYGDHYRDDKLEIKGDRISFTNLEEVLKRHSKLLLMKCLLEYFAIDPTVHYVDYPDKE